MENAVLILGGAASAKELYYSAYIFMKIDRLALANRLILSDIETIENDTLLGKTPLQ